MSSVGCVDVPVTAWLSTIAVFISCVCLIHLTQHSVSSGQSQRERVFTTIPRRSLRRDLTQNSAKLVKIHRLRQIEIESSFFAALDIVTRSKTGDRHGF